MPPGPVPPTHTLRLGRMPHCGTLGPTRSLKGLWCHSPPAALPHAQGPEGSVTLKAAQPSGAKGTDRHQRKVHADGLESQPSTTLSVHSTGNRHTSPLGQGRQPPALDPPSRAWQNSSGGTCHPTPHWATQWSHRQEQNQGAVGCWREPGGCRATCLGGHRDHSWPL